MGCGLLKSKEIAKDMTNFGLLFIQFASPLIRIKSCYIKFILFYFQTDLFAVECVDAENNEDGWGEDEEW